MRLPPLHTYSSLLEIPELEPYLNQDTYSTRLDLTKIIAKSLAGYKHGCKAKDIVIRTTCLEQAISYMQVLLDLEEDSLFDEDGHIDISRILANPVRYGDKYGRDDAVRPSSFVEVVRTDNGA